ncbi:MAG: ParA family protein [Anaerolineales bacterium]
MTRKLVIANQKGGIGKSTAAANLGRAFSEKGYRVLLIDLDPQGGLSASLGVNSFEVHRSTYTTLMHPASSLARVLRPVAHYMALAPASIDLASAEVMLAGQPDGTLRLRDALAHNQIPFDFVIIDTPPTLGVLTANGLVAADELLVPVQCQFLAMRGVRSILDTMDRIRQNGMNAGLRLGGVFGTMYHPEAQQSREAVAEMRAVFGSQMFTTVLEYCAVVAEAPAAGLSVLDYQSEHACAQAYRSLAQEILNHG